MPNHCAPRASAPTSTCFAVLRSSAGSLRSSSPVATSSARQLAIMRGVSVSADASAAILAIACCTFASAPRRPGKDNCGWAHRLFITDFWSIVAVALLFSLVRLINWYLAAERWRNPVRLCLQIVSLLLSHAFHEYVSLVFTNLALTRHGQNDLNFYCSLSIYITW